MATLTKIGKHYHARVRTADGTRRTISTHTTDKAQARRVVKESGLEELEASAKAGRLTREAIGVITTGRKHTMVKAIDSFTESMSRRLASKSVLNTTYVITAWVKEMKLESLPPSAITEKHVDEWINNPDSDAKAQTRAIKLSALRGFLSYCSDMGWTMGNPAGRHRVSVNMRLLSHAQKESKVALPFHASEVKRLIRYCEDKGLTFWQFAILISWEIGLRLGDICSLEWDCFTTPGRVTVWTDKRDRRISVPLSDELQQLITLIPLTSDQYLFPTERVNIEQNKVAALSVFFKRLCEKVQITDKSFHCLRHGCITRWAKEGKSLESIGKDVGHANTKTTAGYVH